MLGRIQSEIASFQEVLSSGSFPRCRVRQLCEYGYVIEPEEPLPIVDGKTIGLSLMAICHGDEVGGIAVLNEWLRMVKRGSVSIQMSVAVILGNPIAAIKQKRFIDRDLNRSFLRKENENLEEKRAKEISKVLQEARYHVDIHQTIEASNTGFFIFPYRPESLLFARKIGSRLPIVTHWGGSGFSKDGKCSDEFVNSQGGNGITLELGQIGFSVYQVALGVQMVIRSYEAAMDLITGAKAIEGTGHTEIFTWGQIIPYLSGETKLDPGWVNFQKIEKGQQIGVLGGKVLKAEQSGQILFPKYIRTEDQKPPAELCRIMRRVELAELEGVDAPL